MLKQANSYRLKTANTKYLLSESPELERTLAGDRFDLVYTNITLQHLDSTPQKQYIGQLAKLLQPNGLAIFQIPSQKPRRSSPSVLAKKIRLGLGSIGPGDLLSVISKAFRSRVMPWDVRIELNILPEAEVEGVAATEGLQLLRKAYVDWDCKPPRK